MIPAIRGFLAEPSVKRPARESRISPPVYVWGKHRVDACYTEEFREFQVHRQRFWLDFCAFRGIYLVIGQQQR